jgi:AraC-like DNA-binding protein
MTIAKMEPKIIEYDFPQADSLEREVQLIGLDKNMGYNSQEAHRHNYFELFYFTKAGGKHAIDFSNYPVSGQNIHMVMPGALHLLKRKPGSAGHVVLFTKAFLYSLMDFSPYKHQRLWSKKAVYPLSTAENDFVRSSIEQLKTELEKKRAMRHEVISSLLRMVFILMFRQAREKSTANQNENNVVPQFFELLENNFLERTSAGDYAEKLNCSLKTLNQELHRANCPSVLKNLVERRVLEAKRLLAYSGWSIKEIAYHLKFEEPGYFGKVFKKETGKTPLQFRNSNR